MREELLVHERLARDDRYLACAYGAPEVGVGLAAYELGVLSEEVEGVVSDQSTTLELAYALASMLTTGLRHLVGRVPFSASCAHLGLCKVLERHVVGDACEDVLDCAA